jgi:ATP-dependent DNA ligase
MELEKRNFSDFKKFPGKITSCGLYQFPSLYHIDFNNNTRIWTIFIRLVKGNPKKYKTDWSLLLDNIIIIKKEYLADMPIPEETLTQVYAETGVISGKITRHSPTYTKMKNKGKKNERNSFKQGLILARSLYLKKIDNGFQIKSAFNNKIKKTLSNSRYFPMLVRKYDNEKKNLIYPLFVQPKLDGARCVAYLNINPKKNPTINNVILYTRQKKEYFGFNLIKKELLSLLIDMWDYEYNESIYIDGELYKHGLSLQDISGAVRNPNRKNIKKYSGIQYHIFDIFYPKRPNMIFGDRLIYINDLFNMSDKFNCLIQVPTILINTEKEQNSLYKKYLKEKYEGIILRNISSVYLTHPTKNSMTIRSKYVLKRKMTYSDEFEVVGYTQGKKGRDKGAIIWICKTHTTNKQFNTTPKNTTYEERYKLFKLANSNNGSQFKKLYKGRMMTVEYEDLSKEKVPLRAKSIGFREHI